MSDRLRELNALHRQRHLSKEEWTEVATLLAASGQAEQSAQALLRAQRATSRTPSPPPAPAPPSTPRAENSGLATFLLLLIPAAIIFVPLTMWQTNKTYGTPSASRRLPSERLHEAGPRHRETVDEFAERFQNQQEADYDPRQADPPDHQMAAQLFCNRWNETRRLELGLPGELSPLAVDRAAPVSLNLLLTTEPTPTDMPATLDSIAADAHRDLAITKRGLTVAIIRSETDTDGRWLGDKTLVTKSWPAR